MLVQADSTADADAFAEVEAQAASEADAEAQDKMFSYVGKFGKKAFKALKPALANLKKFAGPQAESMLGMTPVGKMLGLGAKGSLDRLNGETKFHADNKSGQKPA